MAVIQYTGIVNQIRGKLNGSVFNKTRNANTLQRKPQPPKGNRGVAYKSRSEFASIQRRWKELTDLERAEWQLCADNNPVRNRFGDLVTLSGYNMFVKGNINILGGNFPFITSPYTDPAPSFVWTTLGWFSILYIPLTQGGIQIQVRINQDSDASLDVFDSAVYLGSPVSPGVTAYHGTYRKLSVWHVGPAPVQALYFGNFSNLNAAPMPGQVVFARLDVVHGASGIVVNTQYHRFVIT